MIFIAWLLLHVLGLDDAGGPYYLWWSGFFGDVALFSAVATWYWHHTCHADGCYRWGRHPVRGTTYVVCRKHHPDDAPTAQKILADYAETNR